MYMLGVKTNGNTIPRVVNTGQVQQVSKQNHATLKINLVSPGKLHTGRTMGWLDNRNTSCHSKALTDRLRLRPYFHMFAPFCIISSKEINNLLHFCLFFLLIKTDKLKSILEKASG